MSFMLLGILNSQVDAGGASAFELISTQLVTSSVSSITFSSIPADFKHLQIRATMRTDRAGNQDDLLTVRLNGDTSSNYSSHFLYGNGSSVASSASTTQTYWRSIYTTGASATTGSFAAMSMDLLDYASTSKNTTMRALNGSHTYNNIALASGLWMNTAAVTSVTFNMAITATNFVSGSRFSLYGVRG